ALAGATPGRGGPAGQPGGRQAGCHRRRPDRRRRPGTGVARGRGAGVRSGAARPLRREPRRVPRGSPPGRAPAGGAHAPGAGGRGAGTWGGRPAADAAIAPALVSLYRLGARLDDVFETRLVLEEIVV